MANYSWTIEHSSDSGSTWTSITPYVQSWSYRYGRQSVTNQWSTGTGIMEGVNPASLPSIQLGDWIRFHEASLNTVYILQVGDYSRTYNIAGANADRWQIALEDAYSQVGRARAQYTASSAAGNSVYDLIGLGGIVADILVGPHGGNWSKCSAVTLSKGDPIAQQVNKLNNQAGAYIQSHRVDLGMDWYGFDATEWYGDPTNHFHETTYSDDGGVNDYEYEQIQFEGLADSYFDAIYVEPDGLAVQTAGTGSRTYGITTFDQTTNQAADWASYLQIQLGGRTQVPNVLITSAQAQKGALPDLLELLPGNTLEIQLRGTNYYSIIEGGIVSANPENTRITLNLSDRDAVNYLLLDNSNFGRLNENRLGF